MAPSVPPNHQPARRRLPGGALLPRAALFALPWWLLAGGAPQSWLFGLPLVLLAAALSCHLMPGRLPSPGPAALLRFAALFLRLSLAGGLDVARRALARRLPLDPGLVAYQTALPPGAARTMLTAVISLLPGTLCARIEGEALTIHTLDRALPVVAQTRLLEASIAALFDHPPPPGGERP